MKNSSRASAVWADAVFTIVFILPQGIYKTKEWF